MLFQNQLLFLWLENISVLLFEYGASGHKSSGAGHAEVDRILRFPLRVLTDRMGTEHIRRTRSFGHSGVKPHTPSMTICVCHVSDIDLTTLLIETAPRRADIICPITS